MSQRSTAKVRVLLRPEVDPWPNLWQSFELALTAGVAIKKGKPASKRTLEIYGDSGRIFYDWCKSRNLPTDPRVVTPAQVQTFLIYLRTDRGAKEATVRVRFSSLRRFFNWCVKEGEIEHSPMEHMNGPSVEEVAPPVMTDDQVEQLFKACRGSGFEDKRDLAIISVMLDTGLRRAEVAGIMVEDLDIKGGVISVHRRKGGDQGKVRFNAKTAFDLDRYTRVRKLHRLADLTVRRGEEQVHPLWLAQNAGLTGDGIHYVIGRRARMAGISGLHPHTLRHQFAHYLKSAGLSDEDIMALGGWRDMKSMRRYGAAARQARAWEAHKLHSPRDRF